MIDTNTRSLWSHLYGKAMRGPLEGAELEHLPSTMTDWGTWRQLHPQTTVVLLSRTTTAYDRDFYRNLSDFVIGSTDGRSARAWPFDVLVHEPVLNDQFSGLPVLVTFQIDSKTAQLFSRVTKERRLSFEQKGGQLIDRETRSVWNSVSGTATSGPLQGTQLEPLSATLSYRDAWQVFYPNTTIYGTESPSQ